MAALAYSTVRTGAAYDKLLNTLYMKATRTVVEVSLPPVRVIAVEGHEPPKSKPYQDAINVLYGIGYGLKMGFKFGKLTKPKGWFDYRVGALETLWWSTDRAFDVNDAATLGWQAYLMLPAFVKASDFNAARDQAKAKHPDVPYDSAKVATIREGRAIQVLHVGPYDREQPTIDALHQYADDHGLAVHGRHHEIYLSDPRRTPPAKLRTVIRLPVRAQ